MSVVLQDLVSPTMQLLNSAQLDSSAAPLAPFLVHGRWITAKGIGDGLIFTFSKGALAPFGFLTADFLLEGLESCVFALHFNEANSSRAMTLRFGLLNACAARLVLPLAIVSQHYPSVPRQGALLKPQCSGDAIDLATVDHLTLVVDRLGLQPVRFCLTPFSATVHEPLPLDDPLLPKGPLVDQLGQSTLHDWPAKTRSHDEVVARIREQSASAGNQKWPGEFSKYGGYAHATKFHGSGFFRVHHDDRDGGRYWLIDPEGHQFFSSGMESVTPRANAHIEHLEKALAWLPEFAGPNQAAFGLPFKPDRRSFSFLIANLIRAFGPQSWYDHWARIALAQLRSFGINTVGHGSERYLGRKDAEAAFPYVRQIEALPSQSPAAFLDFPDIFHPGFASDAAACAQSLGDCNNDPALLGYFVLSEPAWAQVADSPAAGMLVSGPPATETRKALAEFLRQRYGTNERLSAAWQVNTTYISLVVNLWPHSYNDAARADLAAFSTVMVERLLGTLSEACKRVDPHHLNLGVRFPTLPPDWALDSLRHCDVLSMGGYADRPPLTQIDTLAQRVSRPVLITGFQFGALDAGLPAPGRAHVRTQRDRGRAYRTYLEAAAACRSCVGVHYAQLYDQPALGRFDGENYQIGFVDVTNRPYEDLVFPASESHAHMYRIALGEESPFGDAPEYLPPLFI